MDELAVNVLTNTDLAVSIICSEMATLGLELNLDPGRSEVMVGLPGHNSRSVLRAKRLTQGWITDRMGTSSHSFGVVRSYQHVGTLRCIQGTGVQGEQARAKVTTAHHLPIASSFVGHQGIDVDTGTSVVEGLVSSRCVEPVLVVHLPPTAEGILHSGRLRHLTRVLKQELFDDCDNMKEKEVWRMLHVNGTDACVRFMRLYSLLRLVGLVLLEICWLCWTLPRGNPPCLVFGSRIYDGCTIT